MTIKKRMNRKKTSLIKKKSTKKTSAKPKAKPKATPKPTPKPKAKPKPKLKATPKPKLKATPKPKLIAISHIKKVNVPRVQILQIHPKRRKKAASKMYFTQDTEDAIIVYNKTEDMATREKIYQEQIEYPFQKLVENVFNRFGFTYFKTSPHDVQREALAHLVSVMGKYDPDRVSKVAGPKKKSKAFSYFSVIAKNWFILLNNNNYKEFQTMVEISEERGENTVQLQHVDKHHVQVETDEFMNLTIEFWESNIDRIFNKQRDLDIANAVVELLRNSGRIDAFNKKALYLYIREISECKTQQITKVINKMKQYHKNIYKMYLNDGVISNALHLT